MAQKQSLKISKQMNVTVIILNFTKNRRPVSKTSQPGRVGNRDR